MYGKGDSPVFSKWTSRLAVKQALAGVGDDLKRSEQRKKKNQSMSCGNCRRLATLNGEQGVILILSWM